MKKAVRMAVAAGMCAALALSAGCQKKTVADDEVQRYAWPLATASPEDTVTQIYAEKFAEEVEELSDGKMKIQVYPNGTIGGDRELLESCKDGDIPFVIQNTAPQVTFMPDLAVFDIPCRFSTIDEVREKVDDPEFYGILEDVYENGGYKLLGYADQGFRVMSTNKKVESLADFKGQKIRTMENSYHMDFWKKLKASPTPMSFSEVYIGLQQGTIDAQENPYEVIVSNKLYEQQDYVVETNHLPHLISLIVSDEFFQDLPEDKQAILVEAAEIAKEEARQASDDRIADKIKVIEDSGTQIVTLSDELRAEIREAVQPVYDEIEKNVDKKLTVLIEGNIYQILEFQHVKPGKGAAFVRTKLKNIISGGVVEKTFRPTEKFDTAHIDRKDMQYLYSDGELYHFMDVETFDQIAVDGDTVGDSLKFVKENEMVKVCSHEGNVFSVEPPISVELEVTETEPGVKGDTATGATKPAIVETGASVLVPLFVNQGDKIKIDTRTGEYSSRA